ncbi:unnamed protein product, partial [Adineta steineri]
IYLTKRTPCIISATSGTTGRPKAIVHTHGSFTGGVTAMLNCDIVTGGKFLQVAAVSWNVHLLETFMPLISTKPGTLVLLQKNGNLNMPQFCQTIYDKQVTFMFVGSSMLKLLLDYLELNDPKSTDILSPLRNFWTAGEVYKPRDLARLKSFAPQTYIFLAYGLSETFCCIGNSFGKSIDQFANLTSLPIGHPLPGYRCLLIDEANGQIISPSTLNQIGQIHVTGAGRFQCYYNRPDLTDKVRVTINNEDYFRSGDLALYNDQSALVFVGRIDFQIKISGHRIEPDEIESILMKIVTNCVVIKATHVGNDYLVTYVETKHKQDYLRQYCLSHLPLYMVPSFFIIVDKFPLNPNGKLDRSVLPPIDFNSFSLPVSSEEQCQTEMEKEVHSIWLQVLSHVDNISISKSLFELGGNSLSIMELSYSYQSAFKRNLKISDLFSQSTIRDHARLLEQSLNSENGLTIWQPLNITEDRASYAQETVWTAEQIRFIPQSPPIAVYNTPVTYQVVAGHLFINQLLRAIDLIITRYSVFRTCLKFDVDKGYLKQSIQPLNSNIRQFYTVCSSLIQHNKELKTLFFDDYLKPIESGYLRCHFIRCGHTNEELLNESDFIIFTFHHLAGDGHSVKLFLEQLQLTYSGKNENSKELFLQYIDYAHYERNNMDMSEAKHYWNAALRDYGWDHYLDLPYDFGMPNNGRRSGQCCNILTDIPREIVNALFSRAEEFNATLLQLTLTCFYVFLSQLSPRNQDACVCVANRNRYRTELEKVMGAFSNMLPCRIKFDMSSSTFIDLLRQVQQNLVGMINYSYIPYSELIDLHRTPTKNLHAPYFHTFFAIQGKTDYDRFRNQFELTTTLDTKEHTCSLSEYDDMWSHADDESIPVITSMFDTDILLVVDNINKTMAVSWGYSIDLFEKSTIELLSKQFIQLFSDLFLTKTSSQLNILSVDKLISLPVSQ